MNIAFFTDTYLPDRNGVATSTAQLQANLTKMGHKVFIYTVKHPEVKNSEPMIHRSPVIAVNAMGAPEARIAFTNVFAIAKKLSKDGVELIHTHSEFSMGMTGRSVANMLKIPHVHTMHTLWSSYKHYFLNGHFITDKQLATLFRAFVKRCTAVVAPSNKASAYLAEIGVNTYHINNGLDTGQFLRHYQNDHVHILRQRYHIKPDDVVILFIGRMAEEKRVVPLYNVLKKAMQQQANIKAMLIGVGDQLDILQQHVKDDALTQRFIFTQAINYSEICHYFPLCHIYCTVSVSEIQPMTVIEALTMGLPAVVRQDKAFDELVIHQTNGLVADDDDMATQYLVDLATDHNMRRRLGQKAKVLAQNFTAQKQAEDMLELYHNAIQAGRPRWKHKIHLSRT
jgi:1,2-diacylglycerol 3-alpha-glucosyltransferase